MLLISGLLLLFCCFAAAPARADEPSDVLPLLRAMLRDYRRYAETLWKQPADRPGMGFWGSGRAEGGNEGVRAQANTALVYALLHREGDRAFPIAARVEPALRYAAAIHLTGTATGTDAKKWGNSWQSAMWAGNLGVAAWLVRDQLRPDTLAAIERVVAAEADRFVDQAPPTMEPGDTKSEENAWDLTASSAALLLLPDDPRAAKWQQTVLHYGFNTLSVEADKTSERIADGKPLREWVRTVQLFPDFTLENHGFFHPVYAMIGPATNAQAAVAYRLAGREIPNALRHNVVSEWRMLQYIALPDGEWLYPQGLDWDLHDYEHLHYWTMLATLYHDPVAALLEERTARYARRRQQLNGDGSFVGPSGSLGFAREAVQAERVAFALLMHQQLGQPPAASESDWQRMIADLSPVRAFDRAGFVVHRTPRGLLSFSWKNRLMGLAAPASERHPDAPYVTTPFVESLAGRFTIQGQPAAKAGAFTVSRHAINTDSHGFVLAVDAEVNDGLLRQEIAVATAAPGVLAYVDRVRARRDVTITEERGLSVGVENDAVSGNRREVWTRGGKAVMTAGKEQDHALAGQWANVDGRLGLVAAPGSRLLYRAAGKPNRAGAREDILLGAFRSGPRTVATNQIVAERAGLLLPDASPEETAKIAASLRVERGTTGTILRFTDGDGRNHTLALDADGGARWDERRASPAPPAATLDLSQWQITFSDDFDGDSLDRKKWEDAYPGGARTHSNNEQQYYAPNGYEVKNGNLRLRAERRSMGGMPYTSGMVSSFGSFSQTYGLFEIRARFPKGKGMWPAFWLLPATGKWPPEIDVLEILGHEPGKVYMTTHWRNAEGKHQGKGFSYTGPDFSADFHTFAVEWKQGECIWYVDGVERARSTEGVPAEPMYVIANLAVGGDWPGNPDATTPFPGFMDVDYIRVYKRK